MCALDELLVLVAERTPHPFADEFRLRHVRLLRAGVVFALLLAFLDILIPVLAHDTACSACFQDTPILLRAAVVLLGRVEPSPRVAAHPAILIGGLRVRYFR